MSQGKTNSPERRYAGFGLNFLVAEDEQSLSWRTTQYWGRPKMPKLSRNGSRMDDMRNRDRENDRTGPWSIFRPLPDPKNLENRPQTYKKPVWGPSLGIFSLRKLTAREQPFAAVLVGIVVKYLAGWCL